MENEIQTVKDFNVFSILESAVEKGADPDALTKLMDLQERIMKSEAEQAYNKAMRLAQSEMPKIIKTKENKQTGSMYADLGAINEQVTPVYTMHGFSLSFGTEEALMDSYIRIICDVMHEKGHVKKYHFDLPLDQAGIMGKVNKTTIHATASTTSYGQRYLIKMIFNLCIDNEDDDAQTSGQREYIQSILDEGKAIGIKYGMACYRHKEVIEEVKDRLADGDYLAAAEAYYSLTNKEAVSIKLAPTSGGIFTTKEVAKLKSNEWSAVAKDAVALNPNVDRSTT